MLVALPRTENHTHEICSPYGGEH